MTSLEVTSTYYKTAERKLFYFDSTYIAEGHKKLYGEESVFNIVKALVDKKAAAPMFKEFIQEKNGIIPEVECMRVEFLLDAVTELKEKPLLNQMLLEYVDKEEAAATPQHSDIVQLRTDLIDVLELDCNERLLRDEPDELINEWISRSLILQELINQVELFIMEPVFKRFDEKVLSAYILENIIGDLT
jgi:hypothetical protein